ncbi:hypothetical protein [Sphingomonas solaris]|uniref:Uncharacterized protein n=1 Tax=Alterirhizorhabdus solaris TaxID=2529389 RepID=A0A558R682_9SPHN|nr:hypothetical protein [Sphingomonas solaris]TVV74889.1 hypothetical protein FOY91_08630 [Sphingomonas solaris]
MVDRSPLEEIGIMKALAALLSATLATGLLAAPTSARICRDIHGRIVKCRPVVTSPPPGCRDARGHLMPCPAHPDERGKARKAGSASRH